MHTKNKHQPVLIEEVLTHLRPRSGERYLDLTAGYGGHAEQVLKRTNAPASAVLVDRDQNAISHLRTLFSGDVSILHADFLSASKELERQGRQFDLVLADLGVSSVHLDEGTRGFSFLEEARLDMRMDERQELTAAKVVNTYTVEQLTDIIARYGEEPKARQLAQTIIRHRPIKTTVELAELAKKVWPAHKSKVHPATRLFQAIRLEVNDELRQLQEALPIWIRLLNPGGRIVVISFHSLEDRLVKQAFKEQAGNRYDAVLKETTPKPVMAGHAEIVSNPRARSAKLRAAVKIKTKEGA